MWIYVSDALERLQASRSLVCRKHSWTKRVFAFQCWLRASAKVTTFVSLLAPRALPKSTTQARAGARAHPARALAIDLGMLAG